MLTHRGVILLASRAGVARRNGATGLHICWRTNCPHSNWCLGYARIGPPRLSEPHLRRASGFDRAFGSHRPALRLGAVRARGSRAATAGFGGTRAWRTYSGCKRNLDSPNAASGSQTVPDNNVRLSQTRPGITGTRIGAVAQPTPKLRRRAGMSLTKQSVVSSARELSAQAGQPTGCHRVF